MATKHQRVPKCVTAAVTRVDAILRTALDHFRRKATAMNEWNDPALASDREALTSVLGRIAELESSWERVESRSDFQADQSREQLRRQLPPEYKRRDVLSPRVARGEERQRLVRGLIPQYEKLEASLIAMLDRLKASTSVPSREEFTQLYLKKRELGDLARVLHAATGERRFSREFDAVDALKFHWHEQRIARDRLFMMLSPGSRPRASEPVEWAEQARRLSELSAQQEELANAR